MSKEKSFDVDSIEDLKHIQQLTGVRIAADFYLISLKEHDCGMTYGRGYYDFQEGTLIFTAPNQVIQTAEDQDHSDMRHNELDRNNALRPEDLRPRDGKRSEEEIAGL